MLDSVSGVANLAIALQQQKLADQVNMAVLNKTQDIQKQQGEAILSLLNSAQVPQTTIDVKV